MVEEHQVARLEYAAKGLVGCLTPQANTTVEPEFNILLPAGYAVLNARLTSLRPIAERAACNGPPLLSCMLCLVWRTVLAARGGDPDAQDLRRWLGAAHWQARLYGDERSDDRRLTE